jgi:8-oxo-dGTP pyrophosphatase MutT (NUDIX family)
LPETEHDGRACENAAVMDEPRPAATLVLARPSEEGIEVLILTRAEGNRFLPGFAVFPGGTVERWDVELATTLFRDAAEEARACALRELYEEASILLTGRGPIAQRPEAPIGSIAFDPPGARTLVEIGRWIAPEFIETRFDARFFAVAAPRGIEPEPDGIEISDARWLTPRAVLDAVDAGETQAFWPTLVTLRALAECREVADVLALRVEQIPDPRVAG